MKILVRAPISPFTGYGRDGLGIIETLARKGHDIYLQPNHVDPPVPQYIANLFTKRLDPPFDLALVHVDPGQLLCTPGMRRSSEFVVGWSMWEMTTLSNMAYSARKNVRKQLKDFDAIVGYDEVSVGALREYAGKVPVLKTQGGMSTEEWKFVKRDWHSPRFRFFMHGQLAERKNPFVAVEAYDQLKQEHPEFESAELYLHSSVPGLHPLMEERYHNLKIIYQTLTQLQVHQLYESSHCILAPSRGEGKNLPCLEFQSTGGVAIATNFGGHTEWISPDFAYPLNYKLQYLDHSSPKKTAQWAQADVNHLKELMWHVFTHREEAEQKGRTASEVIPAMCNWESATDRMFQQLRTVPGGERLWEKYRIPQRDWPEKAFE